MSKHWLTRSVSLLATLLLLLPIYGSISAHRAHATTCTYYVNNDDGSDSYNGQAPYPQTGNAGPWKDMTPVNATVFAPGDVICF